MKSKLLASLVVATAIVSSGRADAHFKLTQPVDALKTNATGDPTNGDQKTSPCGEGASSGLATQVRAGSKLHVKLTETIVHGGHYRIALVPTSQRASLVDPVPVVEDDNCVSAPIDPSPALPVLADGLFVHTEDDVPSGMVWETDVTLPDETCDDCTLQVIQFMTPHAPGCFYYHCAKLQILDADAEIEGDGVIEIGTESTGSSSGSTGGGGGADDDGSSGSSGSSPSRRLSSSSSDGGCNAAGGGGPSLAAIGVIGAIVLARFRRRAGGARDPQP